jgi:hypothetical protein
MSPFKNEEMSKKGIKGISSVMVLLSIRLISMLKRAIWHLKVPTFGIYKLNNQELSLVRPESTAMRSGSRLRYGSPRRR